MATDGVGLPVNQILSGDCVEALQKLPEKSVDLIFADPPYNLQLKNELYRPNMTRVDGVDESWDRFEDFKAYDDFTRSWLSACRRVLKDSGAIWVIGTYHNIYRMGAVMQDLGFWFLNDIVWIKTNPMPNFRGVRFANAHETLIWASKYNGAHYTFNNQSVRSLNDDLQMRSDWLLPVCPRQERLKENGEKVHPTQKPETLLYRIILATTRPGDIVLDPFFGTGTSGVVAKRLNRRWIGIEREEKYILEAQKRLDSTEPVDDGEDFLYNNLTHRKPRLPFGSLLENGMIKPGQTFFFKRDRSLKARVCVDGRLVMEDGVYGSIHKLGSIIMKGIPCNGWEHWYFEAEDGQLKPIDEYRKRYFQMESGKE